MNFEPTAEEPVRHNHEPDEPGIRHNQSGIRTVIIYKHRPLRGHQVQSRPLRGHRRIRSSRRSAPQSARGASLLNLNLDLDLNLNLNLTRTAKRSRCFASLEM